MISQRPKTAKLICTADVSAFALTMTFVVFAVLVLIMTVRGNPPQGFAPDLPKVHHPKMVGSLTWGANNHDAMIAMVARDGRIYFGHEEVSANELPAKIRECLNGGAERRVYIKADARARYGAVKMALLSRFWRRCNRRGWKMRPSLPTS